METRRGFLRSIFIRNEPDLASRNGSVVRPKELGAISPTEKREGMDRRNFLKLTTAVALGTVVDAALPRIAHSEDATPESKHETELKKCWDVLPNALYYFLEKNNINTQQFAITTQEQEVLRAKFLGEFSATFGKRVDFVLEKVALLPSKRQVLSPIFSQTLHYLSMINCQGVLFACLKDKIKSSDDWCAAQSGFMRDSSYFGAITSDYFPSGSEIFDAEIDPRVNVAGKESGNDQTRSDIDENIDSRPGWLEQENKNKFKKLLANEVIRKRIIEEGLNLAEAYSIIKATIRFRDNNLETILTDELILEKLLDERRLFMKKTILGPETDSFIHFDYFDSSDPRMFNGDWLDSVAANAGVRNDSVTRISGERDGHKVGDEIFSALRLSGENTTLYFNAHGLPNDIMLSDPKYGGVKLGNDILASMLVESRLINGKNRKGFENLVIIIDSCFSYSFASNLITEIRLCADKNCGQGKHNRVITMADYLGVDDFESLAMPTIISAAQMGSLAFGSQSSGMAHTLGEQGQSIKKEGRLTGEYFSKRIQPELYPLEDATIFVGGPGKVTEIGMLTQNSESNKQA